MANLHCILTLFSFARVILKYLDGTRSSWKSMLDAWFASTTEGRGAVFSTMPATSLLKSTGTRELALPSIFRQALHAFRELPFEKATEGKFTCQDEARSEPLWTSRLFTISHRARDYYQTWRAEAETNRISDLFTPEGELWTNQEIVEYFLHHFKVNRSGLLCIPGKVPIEPSKLSSK